MSNIPQSHPQDEDTFEYLSALGYARKPEEQIRKLKAQLTQANETIEAMIVDHDKQVMKIWGLEARIEAADKLLASACISLDPPKAIIRGSMYDRFLDAELKIMQTNLCKEIERTLGLAL